MDYINRITEGNCLQHLKGLPDRSVNTCVTSPPYWGLRDYGNNQQLGMEETPEAYIANLVAVFTEVKRVLEDDGTLWVNIGDSYASAAGGYAGDCKKTKNTGFISKGTKGAVLKRNKVVAGLKPKDLVGIPWLLAFALRADGWYLRQDIIWSKPNCMPEAVKDRCTKTHEYIFLLSKKKEYYYDYEAIRTPMADSSIKRAQQDIAKQKGAIGNGGNKTNGRMKMVGDVNLGANKKSVWTVSPSQFKEAHFATFPEKLIVDCIKAGCPEHGVVLDPFMGAGTTALVASKLNRHFIGFELNPDYIAIANRRLDEHLGMFRKEAHDV
jgi:DNA modification methylase